MNQTEKNVKKAMETARRINLQSNGQMYAEAIIELSNAKVHFRPENRWRYAEVIYIGELGNYFSTVTPKYNIGKPYEMHPYDAAKFS